METKPLLGLHGLRLRQTKPLDVDTKKQKKIILNGVSKCVRCGMCMPLCPTFSVTSLEADSPRGRLSMMGALANGKIQPSRAMVRHIDQCLHCGICENICPAEVRYAELIDQTKQLLAQKNSLPSLPWWLKMIACSRLFRLVLKTAIGLLCRLGLRRMLVNLPWGKRSHLLAMTSMLADGMGSDFNTLRKYRPTQMADTCPLKTKKNKKQSLPLEEVCLFAGCVSEIVEPTVLLDAKHLLCAMGFQVRIPRKQGCCGALFQHCGDMQTTQAMYEQNKRAFPAYLPIISLASGCGAQWTQHNADSSWQHYDIFKFIEITWDRFLRLTWQPFPHRVMLHIPCTMRNVLDGTFAKVGKVLQRIPELKIFSCPAGEGCCGAAGIHMLRYPKMANAILQKTLDKLRTNECREVKILLTTNVGCAMHLRRALFVAGLDIRVIHPVNLLASLLR